MSYVICHIICMSTCHISFWSCLQVLPCTLKCPLLWVPLKNKLPFLWNWLDNTDDSLANSGAFGYICDRICLSGDTLTSTWTVSNTHSFNNTPLYFIWTTAVPLYNPPFTYKLLTGIACVLIHSPCALVSRVSCTPLVRVPPVVSARMEFPHAASINNTASDNNTLSFMGVKLKLAISSDATWYA